LVGGNLNMQTICNFIVVLFKKRPRSGRHEFMALGSARVQPEMTRQTRLLIPRLLPRPIMRKPN
jgi:hypothetical protein